MTQNVKEPRGGSSSHTDPWLNPQNIWKNSQEMMYQRCLFNRVTASELFQAGQLVFIPNFFLCVFVGVWGCVGCALCVCVCVF